MRNPIPKREGGKWIVDLRPEFGWHYVLGPDSLPEIEAVNLAWQKLFELREKRASEPVPQLEIAVPGTAPKTFAVAVDRWEPLKLAETIEESKSYVRTYAKRVRKALGPLTLSQFVDGGGQARLVEYLQAMRDAGESARTIRNSLNTVRQVLAFCSDEERRWIPFMPRFPKAPKVQKPQFDWVGEEVFRAIRARIYQGLKPGQLAGILKYEKIDVSPELYVERRKLYLSWCFYTGHRTHDADDWTADDVGLDVGTYLRHGQKTDAAIEQFEMPEPFVADLRAYLRIVGREFFLPREPIGGGPWKTVARILQRAASAIGVGKLNARILRRSFARKMFELGYTIKQVADRMSHVDLRMLHEIYVRTPRPVGRARSLWKITVPLTPGPTSGPPNKVLKFGAVGSGPDGAIEGNEANNNDTGGEGDDE